MFAMNDFQFIFKLQCLTKRYGDGASNTIKNYSVSSLILMY